MSTCKPKKPLNHRDQLLTDAWKHAELAFIYADDGAFATASKLLRETAEMFDVEFNRRQALMHQVTRRTR